MKNTCFFLSVIIAIFGCTLGKSQSERQVPDLKMNEYVAVDSIALQSGVFTQQLDQSEITVVVPEEWNRKLLLLAHGSRPAESKLSSLFHHQDPFFKKLGEDGWLIASTSYRRNGVIIQDAIEDLELLRKFIEEYYGPPSEIYLQGSSMGASIATLIAENSNMSYTGVLAIGLPRISFLQNYELEYSYNPQIPILFVSNHNETEPPIYYLKKNIDANVKPAFWTIDRDGHCLVNSAEITQAFDALQFYGKRDSIQYEKDGTIEIEHLKSKAILKDDKAFAEVQAIHPSFGNFTTAFTSEDLEKLGVAKNSYFLVGCKDRYFRIYYGTTYSDVAKGFWIAFAGASGTIRIARNFANAAKTLECHTGDEIYIELLPEEECNIQPYILPGSEGIDLGIRAWNQLLIRDVLGSIESGEKALQINPDLLWIKMNLAHAYLVANSYEKAVEIYQENIGKHILKQSFYFEDMVLEDLNKLEDAGLNIIYFDKIREMMME